MTQKETYSLNIGEKSINTNHKYLIYKDKSYNKSEVRKLVCYIINKYTSKEFNISKLRKAKNIGISWTHDRLGRITTNIVFNDVVDKLLETGTFDSESINLPKLESYDFDSNVDIGLPQPFMSLDGKRETVKFQLQMKFGKDFPITPSLDREGFATSNLQSYVIQNAVNLHKMLVQRSHLSCSIRNEWFLNFRMMANECISAVDMQLHHIYLLAQYRNKDFGWEYNPENLGSRYGQRTMDKFKWIGKITGKPLDDAKTETESFKIIKDIRNHLNHFDPPCFCCSLEDLTKWFNLIPNIGRLLWKIREKVNTQLSQPIVEMIMLPHVDFVPLVKERDRPIPVTETGYCTSIWK